MSFRDELHRSEPSEVCLECTEGIHRGGNYNSPVMKESGNKSFRGLNREAMTY